MPRRSGHIDYMAKPGDPPELVHIREFCKRIESRIQRLERTQGINSGGGAPGGPGGTPFGAHVWTHASQRASIPNSGTDPLDVYEMDWLRKHDFRPSTDVVGVSIHASNGDHTANVLAVTDKIENDAVTVSDTGNSQFGGANEAARVNITPKVSVSSAQPDEIGITPYFWHRSDADNVTPPGTSYGQVLGGGSLGTTAWQDLSGNGRDLQVHTGSALWYNTGPLTINGTPAIYFPNNQDITQAAVRVFSGSFTLAFVHRIDSTLPAVTYKVFTAAPDGTHYSTFFIGGRKTATCDLVIQSNDGLGQQEATVASFDDTLGNNWGIFIVRRNSSDSGKHYVYYGSDTQSPAERGAAVTLTLPFRYQQVNADHPTSVTSSYQEIVAWDSFLSDAQVYQIYQYMALRYGALPTTGGGSGDIMEWQNDSGVMRGQVDNDGRLGLLVDPAYRFDVLDTTGPQVRIGYNGSQYFTVTVSSSGVITLTPTGTGTNPEPGIISPLIVRTAIPGSPDLANFRYLWVYDKGSGNDALYAWLRKAGVYVATPIVQHGGF